MGIQQMIRSSAIALLLWPLVACGAPDPAGQYAFVQVVAQGDTVAAGRAGAHGTLHLQPGGRLLGESAISGMPIPFVGTWYLERDTLRLELADRGSVIAGLNRQGELRFSYPLIEADPVKVYEVVMKSDLRNLVSAQESFFSDFGRYTRSITQLNFRPSTGATAPQITVVPGGWTAVVTHSQAPRTVCGIAVNLENPVVQTAGEGDPACRTAAPKDTLMLAYTWKRLRQ